MNGIKMNGINSIYTNPLIGNQHNLSNPLDKADKTKESIMPKGTISGVSKVNETEKSGFTIQMNADNDILELSDWRAPEVTKVGDMTEAEQKDVAKQFLKERLEIEEQYKNGELGWEERNELCTDLDHKYEINMIWGYSADGQPHGIWGNIDDVKIYDKVEIQFYRGKSDKPPRACLSKEEVHQIPVNELPQAISTEAESNNFKLQKTANQTASIIPEKGERRLSYRLIEQIIQNRQYQVNEKIRKRNAKEDLDREPFTILA